MPNQRAGGLVRVDFWADRKLRQDAADRAASEGRSLSEVLREFLREYAERRPVVAA